MMENVRKRKTGIELLRIIAMLMILSLHYANLGGAAVKSTGFNLYFARFIEALSYSCVDIFVLITGFFWNKNTRPVQKTVKLWLQTVFYSAGCWLVLLPIRGFSSMFLLKKIAYAFFPFTTHHYWFIVTYVLLLFAAPFLNMLIEKFDFTAHTFLIVFIALFFVVPGTVLPARFTADSTGGYGILWFACLYIIGAYLQKYDLLKKIPKPMCFLMAFVMSSLLFLSGVILEIIHKKGLIPDWWGLCYGYLSLPVVASAVFLFQGLKDFEVKKQKLSGVVKWLSANSLGVYLLHVNGSVGGVLYTEIFKNEKYFNSPYMVLHFILFVVSVFAAGIVTEAVRVRMFGKINDRLSSAAERKVTSLYEKIRAKLLSLQKKDAVGE